MDREHKKRRREDQLEIPDVFGAEKRNSVDADSVAVSSFVGTRPMARARARSDSPENSPEIRWSAMAQPPRLCARRCRPDVS